MNNAQYWIEKLNMNKHPEGGYFKETYRSHETIGRECLPKRYNDARAYGTAIYFLLETDNISAFHKIKSDELWFFHTGDPVEIYLLQQDGLITLKLGHDPEQGETLQAILPAQTWFAARPQKGQYGFSLMSCTVNPGFDFDDFELAKRQELEQAFPAHKNLIRKLSYE